MRLHEKVNKVTVTQLLRLGKNALMQVVKSDGTEKNISSDELINALDNASRVETLSAAKTLTAADSGKTFFLGDADGFAVTLPAPAAGLNFEFKVSVAPTDGDYTIVTDDGDNIMIGSVSCSTADDLGASDANADVITLVEDAAIVGDWVHLVSDGTSWYFKGNCFVAEGITTGTT